MTVGELKAALEGVPDDVLVLYSSDDESSQVVTGSWFEESSLGRFFWLIGKYE